MNVLTRFIERSILANENFEGQNTVTIKSSDVAFEANGDCVWQKVG